MNLSGITYPKDTKDRVGALLVEEARRKPKAARKWPFPVVIAVAGTALVGSTAAGIYTAFAPVNDRRDIRCYYHADLTSRPPVKALPGQTMPPYITAGVFDTGFDAGKDPNPNDKNAGMKQVNDPVNLCSRVWSEGLMNPDGFTNNLIPADFVPPEPGSLTAAYKYKDQNGHAIIPYPEVLGTFGHYIPHLTECVVDNTVAVIPGGPEICTRLGVPALQE
ncbi:hypothetical protein SPF06_04840 [Sinomonas sp. JGH33]|uniref:Uncharacterized protein n=1 Tax=Sinomonas terricola TaxID=3110330 RepID=A0ABU5T308_9MICC|nr:hypothetical protein [Sinomonas sp. JGH33]MEA5454044.1 hypothetical protein [Sinomonas sp. JGH33]